MGFRVHRLLRGRGLIIAGMTALMAGLIAACGGGDDPTPTTSSPLSTPTATAPVLPAWEVQWNETLAAANREGSFVVSVARQGYRTGAERFMEFFGIHALTLDDEQQVLGNFNKHMMNKSLIFADEAFFAGNRKHAAKLKTLISRPDQFIQAKFVDGIVAPKMFRLIMASNDHHIIQAERDDRRSLVLSVDAGEHNQSHDYFARMQREC